jgi:glutamate synthase (ferredoxin)
MCNTEMVGLEPVEEPEDISLLRRLLTRHLEWTGSSAARRVLANWSEYQRRFVKVMPHDLRRALEREQARSQQSEDAAARAV